MEKPGPSPKHAQIDPALPSARRSIYCHDPACPAVGTGAGCTCTPTIRYELPYRERIARTTLEREASAAFIRATREREKFLMGLRARRIGGERAPPGDYHARGGQARAASMSPQQRSEMASAAAKARWERTMRGQS